MAQELALTGGAGARLAISELSTTPLWKLATKTAEPDERRSIIRRIGSTPALRNDALRLAGLLQAAAFRHSTDAEIYTAMQPMTLVYRLPDFEDGGDKRVRSALLVAWQKVYNGVLRDLPIEALRAGVEVYLKASTFGGFPAPGELRAKVEPFANDMRVAAYRLKAALEVPAPAGKIDRAANRKAMEEAGWLGPDGKVDATRILSTAKRPPSTPRPTETPQEMAARLRRSAPE